MVLVSSLTDTPANRRTREMLDESRRLYYVSQAQYMHFPQTLPGPTMLGGGFVKANRPDDMGMEYSAVGGSMKGGNRKGNIVDQLFGRRRKGGWKSFMNGLGDVEKFGRHLVGNKILNSVQNKIASTIDGAGASAGGGGASAGGVADLLEMGAGFHGRRKRGGKKGKAYKASLKGGSMNPRAQIVKAVMQKTGLKLIDASKYVKEHGLYK